MKILPGRLLEDLHTLRSFGRCGTGVVRQSFSAPDRDSRQWLVGRLRDAGLEADIDGVGNVVGRARDVSRALLIGSHTDTQREGGWLDGALGVMYALEIARARKDSGITGVIGIDVGSWIDEEGTFLNFFGSRSYCRDVSAAEIDAARDADGTPLREAIRAAGYSGLPRMELDRNRTVAYLEGHIEQGRVLESSHKRIGVVTGIIGAREYCIEFEGEQNHAGTTPMHLRQDAAAALFAFAGAVSERFRSIAPREATWTMARVELKPNAASIVPGWAALHVQFRDTRIAVIAALEAALNEIIDGARQGSGARVSRVRETIRLEPVLMAEDLQSLLGEAAEHCSPNDWMTLPSGAGHDAMIFGSRVPSGMLFVPSVAGISHSFREDTAEADIVLGCEVLADAVARLLRKF